jgi:exodeoxyribonuclease VII large subunit
MLQVAGSTPGRRPAKNGYNRAQDFSMATSRRRTDVSGSSSAVADDQHVLSISEVSAQIKDTLQTRFDSIWVVGEVSDLARPRSGHVYLTLKDEGAQLRAVIWRNTAERIRFPLEDGIELVCFGQIDVYPPRGSYQLVIRKVELRGEGAAQKALRKLKAKLAAEGLFDPAQKQLLPVFPRRVAIVTSPSGAALSDFLQVAQRRWRGSEILVLPASVQGAAAVDEVVAAMRIAHRLRPRPDVMVITRGGGSLEDLWSFNDERLVRAIFESQIPVVSAIGHEIDVTLADLVADVRALTPTEAAERVLPSRDDVASLLNQISARMTALLRGRLATAQQRLQSIASRPVFRLPYDRTQQLARYLDEMQMRGARALRHQVATARQRGQSFAARLEALSPLAVLGRGYSVTQTYPDGPVIDDADRVKLGTQMITRLKRGEIISRVEETRPGALE